MLFLDALWECFGGSIVGQGIYYLSSRQALKPYYERPEYVVPEKYSLPTATYEGLTDSRESRASSKVSEAGLAGDPPGSDEETTPGLRPGEILVTWDGPDDPSNPKNWSLMKKTIQVFCVFGLTLSAYMGTAIFTPSAEQMIKKFNCTETQFGLGITLFVWGYGIGPILFAPMSESPHCGGRLYTYLFPQLVFCALQLATALINHISSFAVLRFLAGIFAAAPLTNGAGSIADMFLFPRLPFVLSIWSLSFVTGPYIGPLIGAALTHSNTWRWSFYFLLMVSGGVLLMVSFIMVETSAQEILMRKARVLRNLTKNPAIISMGEIKSRGKSTSTVIKELLWGPVDLCIHEPVMNLITLHLALVYSLFYLFFECFPIIYFEIYHFTDVELGLAYVSLMVGFAVAFVAYMVYLRKTMLAKFKAHESITPERLFVRVCLVASFFMPAGIFIVGWASTYHAHWIGSMIGAAMFGGATWLMFQTYVSYIGQLYPFRFASAMASNTFMRSLIGGAFPLFGRFLYINTGSKEFPVGWGSSILAFCGIAMMLLPIYLYIKGEGLRERALAKYGNRDI